MRNIGLLLLITLSCSQVIAGFNGITHHSRANCGNNESISWDWTNDWWFWVNSEHSDSSGNVTHGISSGWQLTWCNAAVHWGKGRGEWLVHGEHYMIDAYGNSYLMQVDWVNDCSIYDGWWDRNK